MRIARCMGVLLGACGMSLVVLLTLSQQVSAAGSLFVKSDGNGSACTQPDPCGLQSALAQANAGDTLYLAAGMYTGTGGAVLTVTKSITLYGGWDGAPVGSVVRAPGTFASVLDGEDQRRVLFISGNITPTIDGFTITRGNASGKPDGIFSGGVGAGIYSLNASPVIAGNVITANSIVSSGVKAGGGMYVVNASNLVVRNNLISHNVLTDTLTFHCNGYGAGFDFEASSGVVENNTFSHNQACTGGGFHAYVSTLVIAGNRIEQNLGTGAYLIRTNATLRHNTIVSNTGGGLNLYTSPALVDANIIYGNTGGGGIYAHTEGAAPFTLSNNLVFDNSAPAGGGVYISADPAYPDPAQALLLHNTIVGNANEGVYVNQFAVVTLTNNIIVSHTFGIYGLNGVTVTAQSNLFFANSAGDTGGSGVTNAGALSGQDPQFVNPSSGDLHLRPSSPAINAGAPTSVTDDLDGDPRLAQPDIGADEYVLRLMLPLIVR